MKTIVSIFLGLLLAPSLVSAASVPTHSSLPESKAPESSRGEFSFSQSYSPGSDWSDDGLSTSDERRVFHTKIEYEDGAYDPRDFELRMGKGGQFYSLQTSVGELIGRQHTFRESYSYWNDAVLMSVVQNTHDPRKTSANSSGNPNLERNKNSDMNQGGTYKRDGMDEPFYSPMLRFEELDDDEIRSIIWTPTSAQPSDFESGIFYDQRVKALGNGVVEITQLMTNAGPDAVENRQTVPWTSFSGTILDTFGYQDTAGELVPVTGLWSTNVFDLADSNGAFQFLNTDSPGNIGLSIITGGEKYDRGGGLWRKTDFRLGELHRPHWPSDTELILSNRRSLNIEKGETVFFRYYLVVGTERSMNVAVDRLTQQADYGYVAYTEESSEDGGLNYVCAEGDLLTIEDCDEDDALFALYDHPITDAKPFLVLKDTDADAYVYSHDPYAISRISSSNPGRFYDGQTEYLSLLGWAVPSTGTTLDSGEYIAPADIAGFDLGAFAGHVLRRTLEDGGGDDGDDNGDGDDDSGSGGGSGGGNSGGGGGASPRVDPVDSQSQKSQNREALIAQINELLAIVEELKAKLAAQRGYTCTPLTGNYNLGDKGPEILQLQRFLNSNPSTRIAASGPGSPGNETDYYGTLTSSAVKRYQELHMSEILTPVGLSRGSGYFGPSTRTHVNRQCQG